MDFSIFGPLLELREQLLEKAADINAPQDKASVELLTRVAHLRDRALTLAAKATPTHVDEMFRAANAPLPAPPAAQPEIEAVSKALRASKTAKTADTAKTVKATKTAKAPRAAKKGNK
jgi:hypothetical protein